MTISQCRIYLPCEVLRYTRGDQIVFEAAKKKQFYGLTATHNRIGLLLANETGPNSSFIRIIEEVEHTTERHVGIVC
jgi:hypothetical protein